MCQNILKIKWELLSINKIPHLVPKSLETQIRTDTRTVKKKML